MLVNIIAIHQFSLDKSHKQGFGKDVDHLLGFCAHFQAMQEAKMAITPPLEKKMNPLGKSLELRVGEDGFLHLGGLHARRAVSLPERRKQNST